jgi:hypothetical protein
LSRGVLQCFRVVYSIPKSGVEEVLCLPLLTRISSALYSFLLPTDYIRSHYHPSWRAKTIVWFHGSLPRVFEAHVEVSGGRSRDWFALYSPPTSPKTQSRITVSLFELDILLFEPIALDLSPLPYTSNFSTFLFLYMIISYQNHISTFTSVSSIKGDVFLLSMISLSPSNVRCTLLLASSASNRWGFLNLGIVMTHQVQS